MEHGTLVKLRETYGDRALKEHIGDRVGVVLGTWDDELLVFWTIDFKDLEVKVNEEDLEVVLDDPDL